MCLNALQESTTSTTVLLSLNSQARRISGPRLLKHPLPVTSTSAAPADNVRQQAGHSTPDNTTNRARNGYMMEFLSLLLYIYLLEKKKTDGQDLPRQCNMRPL